MKTNQQKLVLAAGGAIALELLHSVFVDLVGNDIYTMAIAIAYGLAGAFFIKAAREEKSQYRMVYYGIGGLIILYAASKLVG